MANEIVVKEINRNIIDVFHGIGWGNWGRFFIKYTPTGVVVKQIKGIPFKKTEFAQVEAAVNVQH